MKPNELYHSVTGNLPGEGRKFHIDPKFMKYIMKLLIDLYSDSEMAVIRELSTNAWDSHVMAGVSRPIEVQTPSSLSPYFVVRDFGLGLTEEEVYELFAGYGASTKRETNDATGMLGLGSKSPLTYTNQFTMKVTKDGRQWTIAITRDSEGVGDMHTVQESATSEGNGVEIKIPVKRAHGFEHKARGFFQYWKPGMVLLNGKDPSGLSDVLEVSPGLYLRKAAESVVVMGNVPYPAPSLHASGLGLPYNYGVVAYVPIGAVDFAPSREALMLDSRTTKDTIADVHNRFRKDFTGAVQRELDKQPDVHSAWKSMLEWRGLFGTSQPPNFTYKGTPLPYAIQVPTKALKDQYGITRNYPAHRLLLVEKWRGGHRSRGRQHDTLPKLDANVALKSVFVTNFDVEKVTPTHRKKLTQWLDKQDAEMAYLQSFVLLDYQPAELPLIPKKHIVDWSVIKQEKLPKTTPSSSGGTGRIPGSYDLVIGGKDSLTIRSGVPGDEIDQTKPVYYVWGNHWEARYSTGDLLHEFEKEFTIICLPANRLEKFKREQPQIKDAAEYVKNKGKEAVAKLTTHQKKALYVHDRGLNRRYAPFAGSDILDPDIKEVVRLLNVDISTAQLLRQKLAGVVDVPVLQVADPLSTRYPLAVDALKRTNSKKVSDHIVRYINNEWEYLEAQKRKSAAKQPVSVT